MGFRHGDGWHQIHVRLTQDEHTFLVNLSVKHAEPVTMIIRRLVRAAMRRALETGAPAKRESLTWRHR